MYVAQALLRLTLDDLLQRFKTTSETLIGLEDRFEVLKHLGKVLDRRGDYFSGEVTRPGNMMGKIHICGK